MKPPPTISPINHPYHPFISLQFFSLYRCTFMKPTAGSPQNCQPKQPGVPSWPLFLKFNPPKTRPTFQPSNKGHEAFRFQECVLKYDLRGKLLFYVPSILASKFFRFIFPKKIGLASNDSPNRPNQGIKPQQRRNQETLTLEAKAVCAWPRLQTFHPWSRGSRDPVKGSGRPSPIIIHGVEIILIPITRVYNLSG